MEFNKEKFSHFVMQRPYLGEITEAAENEKLFKHALDKAGCGDSYEISVKLDSAGKVVDAKYITYGCGYAQATCCALIESIVGHNVSEIADWSEKDIEHKIEGIMGEYPIHKKAYMFFAKELIDGVCHKALGKEDLVTNIAKN
jgi:NifU-like protein involved in Fe-S cluster formation